MSSISKVSLEDSLYVLQLARETALARNRQAQAGRMTPLVEGMQNLVAGPTPTLNTPPSTGVMGQSDFQTLLNISQAKTGQVQGVDATTSINDRNRLIGAMSEAKMSEVDIARQFSMTREEVQMVLSVQKKFGAQGGAK